MPKKKISELRYRASRVCRVLANPTAYEILHILKKGAKTPIELGEILGVHISTVSHILKSLRQVDLVVYVVRFRERIYRIKEEAIVMVMLKLKNLIERIKTREY
ncbi:MAG: helix-turn-helix domain-containing protein [candidate division WOR-3 bacterium]